MMTELPHMSANCLTVAGGTLWPTSTDPYRPVPAPLPYYNNPRYYGVFGGAGPTIIQKEPVMAEPKRQLRVVRVFLVDPDERVPADHRMLFGTDEKTTDSTDQELFFALNLSERLATHNEYRATVVWEDKTSEGIRERKGLKPIRISDLVMHVTTIATFPTRIA